MGYPGLGMVRDESGGGRSAETGYSQALWNMLRHLNFGHRAAGAPQLPLDGRGTAKANVL